MIRDAIVITTIVGGLFLTIEGTIRLFWPQNLRTEYLEGGSTAILDDQLGHRLRPLARATVSGPEYAVELRTNAEGLRDEVPHPLPKPQDTTRILVLGDSFAYGSANAYDEIWPVLFERRLLSEGHRVDVVKAGVPGYDTRTEALHLERIFADYDPDIVLLTFLPNDLFTNIPIEPSQSDLEAHELPIEGANSKGSDLHSLILLKRLLMESDWLYARLYMMTKRLEYYATPPSETLRRQIEVTKELLERVQSFCRQKGRDLVILSIPQQFQVLAPEGADALGVDVDAIDRDFAAFARERGFTWLPVLPTLNERYRAEAKDLFYRFDGHLNDRGNRAVADYLAEVFIERFSDDPRRPPAADPAGSV
ncbi:MAG TPA: GDSL-type esterase/lipase family protein [Geminicoccaceae bacterium]|nr:GDSL-type esterase/lipase family protein [Geminicoccaceae bacterium]